MYTADELLNLTNEDYKEELEEQLIETETVTMDELELVYSVAGRSKETLDNILYARTGLNDLEQLLEDTGQLEYE